MTVNEWVRAHARNNESHVNLNTTSIVAKLDNLSSQVTGVFIAICLMFSFLCYLLGSIAEDLAGRGILDGPITAVNWILGG